MVSLIALGLLIIAAILYAVYRLDLWLVKRKLERERSSVPYLSLSAYAHQVYWQQLKREYNSSKSGVWKFHKKPTKENLASAKAACEATRPQLNEEPEKPFIAQATPHEACYESEAVQIYCDGKGLTVPHDDYLYRIFLKKINRQVLEIERRLRNQGLIKLSEKAISNTAFLFKVRVETILSSSRERPLPRCRAMVSLYMTQKGAAPSLIAKTLNRDRSSIVYAGKKMKEEIELYPEVRERWNELVKVLEE